jgi:xanthine dehydrogenase accessory factor
VSAGDNTVFVVGAGHVGRAVNELSRWLGYQTVVWDDRAEVLEGMGEVDVRLGGTIGEALAEVAVGPATAIVVVTRNVELDLVILPSLLAAPAGYIGVMGSRRRWDATRSQLIEMGVAATDLDRVRSPIGVEISAETPEEIAVSILSEVVDSWHET